MDPSAPSALSLALDLDWRWVLPVAVGVTAAYGGMRMLTRTRKGVTLHTKEIEECALSSRLESAKSISKAHSFLEEDKVKAEKEAQDESFSKFHLVRLRVDGDLAESFFRSVAILKYWDESKFTEVRARAVEYMYKNIDRIRFYYTDPRIACIKEQIRLVEQGAMLGYPVFLAVSEVEQIDLFFVSGGNSCSTNSEPTPVLIQKCIFTEEKRACEPLLLSYVSSGRGHFDPLLENRSGSDNAKKVSGDGTVPAENALDAAEGIKHETGWGDGARTKSKLRLKKLSLGNHQNASTATLSPLPLSREQKYKLSQHDYQPHTNTEENDMFRLLRDSSGHSDFTKANQSQFIRSH